ncbi:hypothetical protein CCACVL1_27462, partial [Corchorus capsularis]
MRLGRTRAELRALNFGVSARFGS